MSIRLGRQALSVCVVLLAGCWTLPASAVNLITNPGFEGDGSLLDLGWESFKFGTDIQIVDDPAEAHSGNQYIRITAGQPTGPYSSGIYYWHQHTDVPPVFRSAISVIPGGTYTASVFSKAENPPMDPATEDLYGGASLLLMYFDEDNHAVESSPSDPNTLNTVLPIGQLLTANYQQFSIGTEVPVDAVYVGVGLYASKNSSAVNWDDVSIEFAPGPTSPVLQLNIDRGTGKMTLDNVGLVDVPFTNLSMTSTYGSLDPTKWTSVAGNYDAPPSGDGSVDVDSTWSVVTQTNAELKEQANGGNGGAITVAQAAVDLSIANGLWAKSPVEDVQLKFEWFNGVDTQMVPAIVNFFGGTGSAWERGDLNFDGSITSADWPTLRDNLLTDYSSLSKPLAYQQGDLNGDRKVDYIDFALFKKDFDAANGLGAFSAMLAGVPEPASLFLLVVGAAGLSLTRQRKLLHGVGALMLIMGVGSVISSPALAADVNFSTFTLDNAPMADGHQVANYVISGGGSVATLDMTSLNPPAIPQSNAHAFFGTQSVLNKRITGTINPGSDDDIFGLVLGYDAGEMNSTSANYLLLDWMGPAESRDFLDPVGTPTPFQDLTDYTPAFNQNGLVLSRVTGKPTADELWYHSNDPFNNPSGRVAPLQRGTNWGTKRYPYEDILFDISYTSTGVTVKINGVPEISVTGSFGDGGLGLYSLSQGDEPLAPTYKDFRITGLTEVLKATVNTVSGTITLSNNSSDPISLDAYSLQSALSSLKPGTWNSLQNQDLPGFDAGNGTGNGWEESLGSNATKLIEANLTSNSIFAVPTTINLGVAYNTLINAQDLVFTYREPSGLVSTGVVEYVSTIEDADFDGDGDVDGRDFLIWQRGFGSGTTQPQGDANGDGTVNGEDLSIWQTQYGNTGSLASAVGVPEPGTIVLLLLTTGFIVSRRQFDVC